jgi:hypothetical protein
MLNGDSVDVYYGFFVFRFFEIVCCFKGLDRRVMCGTSGTSRND